MIVLALACHPRQPVPADTDPAVETDDTDVAERDPLRSADIPPGFAWSSSRTVPVRVTLPASDRALAGLLELKAGDALLYQGPLSSGGAAVVKVEVPLSVSAIDTTWASRGEHFDSPIEIPDGWDGSEIAWELPIADPPGPPTAPDSDADGVSDPIDVFPCDPKAVTVRATPGLTSWSEMVVESDWPDAGDLDFNDVSFGWHVRRFDDVDGGTTHLEVWVSVTSVDGAVPLGLALHLPLPAIAGKKARLRQPDGTSARLEPWADEDDVVVTIYEDLSTVLGGVGNVDPAAQPVETTFVIAAFDLDHPATAAALASVPPDLFVFAKDDPTRQVHAPIWAGTSVMDTSLFGTGTDASKADGLHFVGRGGIPWMFAIPSQVGTPIEGTSLSDAFPEVVDFAASGGTDEPAWYEAPDESYLFGGESFVTSPAVPKLKPDSACTSG